MLQIMQSGHWVSSLDVSDDACMDPAVDIVDHNHPVPRNEKLSHSVDFTVYDWNGRCRAAGAAAHRDQVDEPVRYSNSAAQVARSRQVVLLFPVRSADVISPGPGLRYELYAILIARREHASRQYIVVYEWAYRADV